MSRRCPAIEQQLTYILNNFVIDLEDALSPRFQLPPFYFTHQSRICPIETGLKIMKGTVRPDRFPHIWKTTNNTLKTLTNFISNYNKDASRSSRIIVQTLLMFLYNLKQKYNVKRWRFLWNEYMVISVEFDNPFDLRAFLRCSYLLREDTRDSFHLIFDHVNDIRLAIPYIEIKNASIQSKRQKIIKWIILKIIITHLLCIFFSKLTSLKLNTILFFQIISLKMIFLYLNFRYSLAVTEKLLNTSNFIIVCNEFSEMSEHFKDPRYAQIIYRWFCW